MAWRDHGVDWDAFDAVLIRSTWDYHEHVDEFISWSEHVDDVSRLYNSAAIVRWNAHKRYLLDLERRGVPIVPTVVVGRGEAKSLAMITHTHGWNEVVVKPAVSAGAKGTGRYRSDEPAGESALSALLETDDVLVQPYVPEIEGLGETSMVAIDGTVTHAVRKVPGDGDFRVQAHHGGRERGIVPTPPELELAASTMEVVSQMASVSYARIDCVTVDGRPILMELEVIEPALYLPLAPSSVADALVMGVVKRAIARR